jgi:hypothetical protein
VTHGEYGIVLNFRSDPANPNVKQVQCPICQNWYGQYLVLFVPRGIVACNRCLGNGASAAIAQAVQRGISVIINQVNKAVDRELAKVIGWLK